MLRVAIPGGALFYGTPRRRTEVAFDDVLRDLVESTARRARELLLQGETPPARREKKCDSCSLLEICKPDAGTKSARRYFEQAVLQSLTSDQGEALD
jgi:CRISPR-associated exonuclease Cas4